MGASPEEGHSPTPGDARLPRTAVVVVTHGSRADVADCFGSLRRALAGRPEVDVIAVDNASADGTPERIRGDHPWVTLIRSDRNLGFAAGCNLGIRMALERGCRFVYLLNPDTEVRPGFLEEALAAARARPDAGAVQSLLLLHGEQDLVNSAGNELHFLGFGYCGSYRRPAREVPDEVREIGFASGAGTLYRAAALERVGLLDEDLFLYQEDVDLGWRLRLAGWTSVIAPRSVVLHKYAFSRSGRKFYYLERNRALVLLKNLRWRSLLLLAPLLAVAEMGVLAFSLSSGWALEKLRASAYLLRPAAWRIVARGRREQARLRAVPDAEIARHLTPVLEFEGVTSPFIRRLVNPAMGWIWRLVRPLIR
ncbi:MAG TPA: glycosyltransferase family 2 protein [Anaeromyxobacteraceae bacterium]|nr:glycosyltransferase family 2 protein [Anaeromyxobacteraceae bacterium]